MKMYYSAARLIADGRMLVEKIAQLEERRDELRDRLLYPSAVDTSKDLVQGGVPHCTADIIAELDNLTAHINVLTRNLKELEAKIILEDKWSCYLLYAHGFHGIPLSKIAIAGSVPYNKVKQQYTKAIRDLNKVVALNGEM